MPFTSFTAIPLHSRRYICCCYIPRCIHFHCSFIRWSLEAFHSFTLFYLLTRLVYSLLMLLIHCSLLFDDIHCCCWKYSFHYIVVIQRLFSVPRYRWLWLDVVTIDIVIQYWLLLFNWYFIHYLLCYSVRNSFNLMIDHWWYWYWWYCVRSIGIILLFIYFIANNNNVHFHFHFIHLFIRSSFIWPHLIHLMIHSFHFLGILSIPEIIDLLMTPLLIPVWWEEIVFIDTLSYIIHYYYSVIDLTSVFNHSLFIIDRVFTYPITIHSHITICWYSVMTYSILMTIPVVIHWPLISDTWSVIHSVTVLFWPWSFIWCWPICAIIYSIDWYFIHCYCVVRYPLIHLFDSLSPSILLFHLFWYIRCYWFIHLLTLFILLLFWSLFIHSFIVDTHSLICLILEISFHLPTPGGTFISIHSSFIPIYVTFHIHSLLFTICYLTFLGDLLLIHSFILISGNFICCCHWYTLIPSFVTFGILHYHCWDGSDWYILFHLFVDVDIHLLFYLHLIGILLLLFVICCCYIILFVFSCYYIYSGKFTIWWCSHSILPVTVYSVVWPRHSFGIIIVRYCWLTVLLIHYWYYLFILMIFYSILLHSFYYSIRYSLLTPKHSFIF